MASSTLPNDNALTGNWLVTGSLPNFGPAAFSPPPPSAPAFGLALSLDVVNGQVLASDSMSYYCGNGGVGSGGYLGAAPIAADGSFILQTPVLSGLGEIVTFEVKGIAPQIAGETWSGTYSATNTNVGCSPVSGEFTAVPIQPVTGTFAGSATLGAGSSGTPVSITVILQQGTTSTFAAPSSITSQNVLSGSIAVQGTACFNSGTLALGQGSVLGGLIQTQFVMNDGSELRLTGAIEDTAVSRIKLDIASVVGGQCDKLFAAGSTDLVRQ
jgi:hypothetical protein